VKYGQEGIKRKLIQDKQREGTTTESENRPTKRRRRKMESVCE
jgi:hypothetical protein